MSDLKDKMDAILSRRGLFVKDISPLSGINPVTVNDIRQKGDCKISQLVKIAKALNVDPCYFLKTDGEITAFNEPEVIYQKSDPVSEQIELLKKLMEEKDKRLAIYEKLEREGKL